MSLLCKALPASQYSDYKSRGAYLRNYLDEIPLDNAGVFSYHGARLMDIVLRGMEHLYRHHPKLVIILGGVNDTTCMNPITRKIQPRFRSNSELCEHFAEIVRATRLLLSNAFPNMVVVFGGVIGADLSRYNHVAGVDPRQAEYDNSILELNRTIRQLNVMANAPHLYFTGKVHKWRQGECHHHYFLLQDSLHPGRVVLKHWASLIADLHRRVVVPVEQHLVTQNNEQ